MSLLADDVAALIGALALDRPAVAGFSMGGMIATIMAIRHPGVARALVNDAGCDIFYPESHSFPMLRADLRREPRTPPRPTPRQSKPHSAPTRTCAGSWR